MIRMKRFIGSGSDGWDASECECDTWYPVTIPVTMETRMTKIHFRIGLNFGGLPQVVETSEKFRNSSLYRLHFDNELA